MTHKINLAFSLSFGYSIFNEEYSQLPQSKLMHAYNLVMRVRKEEKMGEGTKKGLRLNHPFLLYGRKTCHF